MDKDRARYLCICLFMLSQCLIVSSRVSNSFPYPSSVFVSSSIAWHADSEGIGRVKGRPEWKEGGGDREGLKG